MKFTKQQEDRIQEAILWFQKFLNENRIERIETFVFVEGNQEIFGLAPHSLQVKQLKMLNINDIIPFYWKGQNLLAV